MLAVGALTLELQAVILPGVGVYSAGPALLLAALLVPSIGSLGAGALSVIALAVRRGRGGGAAGALADLVPLLACCVAVPLLPPVHHLPWLVVPVLYLALSFPFTRALARRLPPSDYLEWLRTSRTIASLRWGVAAAALPLALLAERWPPAVLLLIPGLLGTHRAAENTLFRVQARAASRVLEADRYQQQVLDRAHEEIDQARRELEATRLERDRLDELTRALTELPGLEPALDLVLQTVAQSVSFRSAAVFLLAAGRLVPARFHSPERTRLEGAGLSGLGEPLVDHVRATGRPWLLTRELGAGPRLFESELCALALPLSEAGVLYVGRAREPFTPEECRFLSWVAARSGLALAVGRRQAAQHAALRAAEEHSQALQAQVDLLAALAQGSRAVAAGLDAERVLTAFETVLRGLVPHEAGGIWLQPDQPRRAWGLPLQGAGPLLQAVVEGGKPLLLNELQGSRLAVPGLGSAVCVPIPGPGAVLLGEPAPGHFTRAHQELLLLLGYQLALALSNARHYQAEVETRRQLQQSQAQLIQSSKLTAVGQLAAGLAHELNTPLGAITISVESALARPDKAQKKLERVLDSSRRCQEIVEKLLIYTRLSSSRPVRVAPAELLSDTLDFFGSQLTEAGFEVATDFQPCPDIEVRQQELQQVFINLLLNARAAAGEGLPRRLLLSCATVRGQASLSVRDWGEGIAAENLSRIFEPFFTTRPVGTGTGLGLSVSHEIVTQHGGTLEVVSSPGQGAQFTVLLPAGPAPER